MSTLVAVLTLAVAAKSLLLAVLHHVHQLVLLHQHLLDRFVFPDYDDLNCHSNYSLLKPVGNPLEQAAPTLIRIRFGNPGQEH